MSKTEYLEMEFSKFSLTRTSSDTFPCSIQNLGQFVEL